MPLGCCLFFHWLPHSTTCTDWVNYKAIYSPSHYKRHIVPHLWSLVACSAPIVASSWVEAAVPALWMKRSLPEAGDGIDPTVMSDTRRSVRPPIHCCVSVSANALRGSVLWWDQVTDSDSSLHSVPLTPLKVLPGICSHPADPTQQLLQNNLQKSYFHTGYAVMLIWFGCFLCCLVLNWMVRAHLRGRTAEVKCLWVEPPGTHIVTFSCLSITPISARGEWPINSFYCATRQNISLTILGILMDLSFSSTQKATFLS